MPLEQLLLFATNDSKICASHSESEWEDTFSFYRNVLNSSPKQNFIQLLNQEIETSRFFTKDCRILANWIKFNISLHLIISLGRDNKTNFQKKRKKVFKMIHGNTIPSRVESIEFGGRIYRRKHWVCNKVWSLACNEIFLWPYWETFAIYRYAIIMQVCPYRLAGQNKRASSLTKMKENLLAVDKEIAKQHWNKPRHKGFCWTVQHRVESPVELGIFHKLVFHRLPQALQ